MTAKEKAKQIKCYCGHTTYCDCGPLENKKPLNQNNMRQTAVEWLVEQYKKVGGISISMSKQAKEMEKENQLDLIRFMRISDKMGKSVEDLYEQFKSE